jgi:two-component system alkaline phosphatase synthesis response regulator PhoP
MKSETHILVVDDDPLVVEALVSFLETRGWNVSTATSGEEALHEMEKHPSLDLVLLDVQLPGIDGFEVLEHSQKAGVVAPVIMISTSADDANRLRAFGLGAEDYLTKPLDPDVLIPHVETVLGLTIPADTSVERRHQVGLVTVDLEGSRVYRPKQDPQPLPKNHRDILRVLLQQRGQAVSRKRLLKEGLHIEADTISFTLSLRALYIMLDELIGEVREIIEPDPHQPTYLERVYGQGYRLRA